MVYLEEGNLLITSMEANDIEFLYRAFMQQGWQKDKETLMKYYKEQERKTREVLIARINGKVAGYITVKKACSGPFIGEYEAQDFNVFMPFRHQKIGYRLLSTLEKIIFERSHCITLAVGLHQGYGQAQKLYIRNGYQPDGSGLWYRGKILEPYTSCMNDDDLVLYLKKERDK